MCVTANQLLRERDDSEQAFLVFARRVKWLRRPSWAPMARIRARADSGADPVRTLWEAWLVDSMRLDPRAAHAHLRTAQLALNELAYAAAPWGALCEDRRAILDGALRRAHSALTAYTLRPAESQWRASEHPWLRVPTTV